MQVDIDDVLFDRLAQAARGLRLRPDEVLRYVLCCYFADLDGRLATWPEPSTAFDDPRFCFPIVEDGETRRLPDADELLLDMSMTYLGIQRREKCKQDELRAARREYREGLMATPEQKAERAAEDAARQAEEDERFARLQRLNPPPGE